jgi:hypothetical protein
MREGRNHKRITKQQQNQQYKTMREDVMNQSHKTVKLMDASYTASNYYFMNDMHNDQSIKVCFKYKVYFE